MAALGKWRNLVQSLVQTGMQIVGDLNEAVVYNNVTSGDYDTTTGLTTSKVVTFGINPPIYGLFAKFQDNESEGRSSVRSDMRIGGENNIVEAKLSIAFLDLPIEPTPADNLTVKGRDWKPVKVLNAPGDPMWVIHIRAV